MSTRTVAASSARKPSTSLCPCKALEAGRVLPSDNEPPSALSLASECLESSWVKCLQGVIQVNRSRLVPSGIRTRSVWRPTWAAILLFLVGLVLDKQRPGTRVLLGWRGDWSHEVSRLNSSLCCWTSCFRQAGTARQGSHSVMKNRGGTCESWYP